jgi:apolipoprotein N-acyltransferase
VNQKNLKPPVPGIIWLAVATVAYGLVGWRWSAPAAAWIAPVFLLRFFRTTKRWYSALLCLPFLYAAAALNMLGAWDLPLTAQLVLPAIVPVPLIAVLYVDRWLSRRLAGVMATLVFPSVYVGVDYALGFTPLGTLFSLASTQFSAVTIVQTASITGIWGISFLITWFAALVNAAWENDFALSRLRTSLAAFAAVAALVIGFGSWRIASQGGNSETVRVAGVTVEHPRDYWEFLDRGTPKATVEPYRAELLELEDRLFEQSRRAVRAGAEIVMWAEGNCVVPEDSLSRFIQRAGAFAEEHGVYLAAGVLELRFGSNLNFNRVLMFAPDGSLAFDYQKTKSWLPVEADGRIRSVDTPYGTVAAAICFDMDFPAFIRQAARNGTDIMLVPGYDSQRISPFHTEVALLRGIEGGFAVVRQANEGTSMASDAEGTVLARQDYFRTSDRIMFADVPVEGVPTLYARLGDWFAWMCIALFAFLVVMASRRIVRLALA